MHWREQGEIERESERQREGEGASHVASPLGQFISRTHFASLLDARRQLFSHLALHSRVRPKGCYACFEMGAERVVGRGSCGHLYHTIKIYEPCVRVQSFFASKSHNICEARINFICHNLTCFLHTHCLPPPPSFYSALSTPSLLSFADDVYLWPRRRWLQVMQRRKFLVVACAAVSSS